MRKLGIVLCFLAALVFICSLSFVYTVKVEETAGVVDMRDYETVSIVLSESGFIPEHVRVRVGTRVVFTTDRGARFWPASNPHPAHSIYPGFDPKEPIEPDASWTFTPTSPGEWGFHDHLRSYYAGVLYVEN